MLFIKGIQSFMSQGLIQKLLKKANDVVNSHH